VLRTTCYDIKELFIMSTQNCNLLLFFVGVILGRLH